MTEPVSATYLVGPELVLARRRRIREYGYLAICVQRVGSCLLMLDVPLAPRQQLHKQIKEISRELLKAGMLKTKEELTKQSFSLDNLTEIANTTDVDQTYIEAVFDSYRNDLEFAIQKIKNSEPFEKPPTNDKTLELVDYAKRRRELYSQMVSESTAAQVRIREITATREAQRDQKQDLRSLTRDERLDRMEQRGVLARERSHCQRVWEDCEICIYFGEDVLKAIIADRDAPRLSSSERLHLRLLINSIGLFMLYAGTSREDRVRLYDLYKLVTDENSGIRQPRDIINQVTEIATHRGDSALFDAILANYDHYIKVAPLDGFRHPRRVVEGAAEIADLEERCKMKFPGSWL